MHGQEPPRGQRWLQATRLPGNTAAGAQLAAAGTVGTAYRAARLLQLVGYPIACHCRAAQMQVPAAVAAGGIEGVRPSFTA